MPTISGKKNDDPSGTSESYKNFEAEQDIALGLRNLNHPKKKSNEKESDSQAIKLIKLIEDNLEMELFHDSYEEPYIRIVNGDNRLKNLSLNSKSLKSSLTKIYYKTYGKPINRSSIGTAIDTLSGIAVDDGKEYELHNRICSHENAIWYDLGDYRAVRITSDGWSIIDKPPILFKKYSHQKSHDIIGNDGNIDDVSKIFNYINISGYNERLLYLVNLVADFIPDIPHSIDVCIGESGSAKSTTMKFKKCLVDPSSNLTLSLPKDRNELIQMLAHNYHPVFDNVSFITQEQSDILCRGVTGEGVSKRTLYSDDDDTIYNYRRCIGYNGINVAGTKSDLLNRSIIFELGTIDNTTRRSEEELWGMFESEKNDIIRGIFTTVSKTMEIRPNIKIKNLPRMADFVLCGCAIAKALGYTQDEFLNAYDENQKLQNIEVIESDIVGTYLMMFVDEMQDSFKPYEYCVRDLYDKLTEYARKEGYNIKSKSWPQDGKNLSRRLKRIMSNLKSEGLEITHRTTKQCKKYTLTNQNMKKPISEKKQNEITAKKESEIKQNEDTSGDYEDDLDEWET